jgi:hypothetical protein
MLTRPAVAATLSGLARGLFLLMVGFAAGVLISGHDRPAAARFDASSLKASFAAACMDDIGNALAHGEHWQRMQTKNALLRVPGVRAGTIKYASGKCYNYMRSASVAKSLKD